MVMDKNQRVFVAGHRGMVGSAILRRLRRKGGAAQIVTRSRAELDLTQQHEVESLFKAKKSTRDILRQRKWAVSTRTIPIRQSSCTTTW
jgi:nucleoside-diphosphate-sugar epimerase